MNLRRSTLTQKRGTTYDMGAASGGSPLTAVAAAQ